jgi:hypothetical protein
MSNELMRSGQKYLATSSDDSLRKDAGGALMKAGLGGGALYLAAGFLPFVTFPMMLIVAVVLGLWLYAK